MNKKIKVGHAFSENIYTTDTTFFKHDSRDGFEKSSKMRDFLLPVLIVIAAFILLARLFYLQVVKGSYYHTLSDSNRLRTTVIHAPRGIIYDRDGIPLVLNLPGFRKLENGKATIINRQEALDLMAKGDAHVSIDSLRSYVYKDAISHVLGYIGQISPDDLKDPDFSSYRAGDFIGKMGIEQKYEKLLRGTDGQKLSEVDAKGNLIRTLGQTDPIPGENITLTVDVQLQKAVSDAMKNVVRGAAIVSKPDGEILALVSRPSFDPNLFTLDKSYQPSADSPYTSISQILLDNQNQPLLNRAISGIYPPGSTFKPVVAATALEDGVINENYTVEDNGILKIGDFSFANWYFTQYRRTEGNVDVIKAIKRSNDIFFYTVGNLLGVDKLSSGAMKFGLGKILGIDLPGEAKGLVPTKEWKKKIIGEDWFTGDDYHYGIGQGYLLTTPLQVNAWTQAIANKGVLYKPHLLKNDKLQILNDKLLNDKNFNLIREGMIEACSPGGVAWPLFNFSIKPTDNSVKLDGKDFYVPTQATNSADMQNQIGISVACKTGTAQHGGEDTQPHAWMTLFAPAYHPQIVVTVLSEDSGEGSNVAGPIAKDILTAWFSR